MDIITIPKKFGMTFKGDTSMKKGTKIFIKLFAYVKYNFLNTITLYSTYIYD